MFEYEQDLVCTSLQMLREHIPPPPPPPPPTPPLPNDFPV